MKTIEAAALEQIKKESREQVATAVRCATEAIQQWKDGLIDAHVLAMILEESADTMRHACTTLGALQL